MLKKIQNIGKLSINKKNVAKISSGVLLSQVIAVITLPIITRIYGAEVIGIWTLLNAIAMLARSLSDLGLTNSIMIEDEENIVNTYKVITTVVAVISIISSVVITLFYTIFNRSIEINTLFLFTFIIFIIFTTQQIQVCYTWLNRKGEYNILMKNPIIQKGIFGITAIVLGLIGMKTYGYFVGHIAGQLATLVYMKGNLPKKMFTITLSDYQKTIFRHKRFVTYQMPTNVLSNFKNQVPVLLVQGLWGTEILGYYSVTVKLLQIPSTLLANAIGRVFFHITSAMKRDGKSIGQYVYRNLTIGMKIAIIPMIFLMAFGDVIAVVFLGSDWKIAGDFVRILTLQFFFMFLMNTVQGLSIILEKQNYAMFSCIFQIIGYILGALIGKYVFDNVYLGLLLMSAFFIVINIIYFTELFRVMGISRKKYISSVLLSVSSIIILSFLLRLTCDYLGFIEFIYNIFRIQIYN